MIYTYTVQVNVPGDEETAASVDAVWVELDGIIENHYEVIVDFVGKSEDWS